MLAGVFLYGWQEQEVNQVSDEYLQGYTLMLDNWKKDYPVLERTQCSFSNLEAYFFFFVVAVDSG